MTVKQKMRHEIVPEHRVLSSEEADEIMAKLRMKREQLPKISIADPIAQEIDASIGDVIEIRRKSLTAGYTTIYRHAIKL